MSFFAGVANCPETASDGPPSDLIVRIEYRLEVCHQSRLCYHLYTAEKKTSKVSQFSAGRSKKGKEAYDLVASGKSAHVKVVFAVAHCQTALTFWGEVLPLVDLGEVAAAVAFAGLGTVRSQRLSQSDGEEESDDGDGLHFGRSKGLMFGSGVRESNEM